MEVFPLVTRHMSLVTFPNASPAFTAFRSLPDGLHRPDRLWHRHSDPPALRRALPRVADSDRLADRNLFRHADHLHADSRQTLRSLRPTTGFVREHRRNRARLRA